MRVANNVTHIIHLLYCITATFLKNESLLLQMLAIISQNASFFVVEISVEAMNTQYILFEKSIAVKTPGRFCSGLQIEVIRVSFQRRFFKIAKLILHFLSAIHCNQHTQHIRTDCDTQNSFQYIYATYVSVDGNKGIKFFVLVITLRLSEMRQVTVRRLCTVRAGTQKSSLVDTSKSHQLC